MKKEAKLLLDRSLDSLLLSIELFNRPWERGRTEGVLIFLDRAFELLLKSIIIHKGSRIREKGKAETIGFQRCINRCVSDVKVRCLNEDEVLTIQIINGFRDAAQHYFVYLSEQQLYLHTQAGVTLFSNKLQEVFCLSLNDFLPERVLPVTTNPPRSADMIFNQEIEKIAEFLAPGKRQFLEAAASLRTFGIIEKTISGSGDQPSQAEIFSYARRLKKGEKWPDVFPGVSQLSLSSEGTGLQVNLRITKNEGLPVKLVNLDSVSSSTPVIAVKRVDDLSYYSLHLSDLALKLGISKHYCLGVIRELRLQGNLEYFKEFAIGKQKFKRYSKKALDLILAKLPTLDLEEIWERNRPRRKQPNA